MKARAIETQAYIIAAAQIGAHNEKRTSYGHSMVVDPWGKVLLDMTGEGSEAEIGVVDVDLEYREKIKVYPDQITVNILLGSWQSSVS